MKKIIVVEKNGVCVPMQESQIFRKVSVNERLPKKDGLYPCWTKDSTKELHVTGEYRYAKNMNGFVCTLVTHWLEEIEMPSEEEIKRKARRDGSLFSKHSGDIWRDGFNECGKWLRDFVLAVAPLTSKTNGA